MDIRTKAIFALVAVALASLFVFGAVISVEVDGRLRQSTLSRLDELAEAKREALYWIVDGWREQVHLAASRTQLRVSLDAWDRAGAPADSARVHRILLDALDSSESIMALGVYDTEGAPVTAAERAGTVLPPSRDAPVPDSATYEGVAFVDADAPEVTFAAPLILDDRPVGVLLVVFRAVELVELTSHFHGLGETGEVLIVALDEAGRPRSLHPTRHSVGDGSGVPLPGSDDSPGILAMSGATGPFDEGLIDYRGETIWMATRAVEDIGWAVIVKVDEVEQRGPAAQFRETLRRTALVLAAFAILAGFVIGLRFAAPIAELAEVAERIGDGDLSARAKANRQDEIGLLARTFNEMAGDLEERMTLLSEYRRFFDVSVDLLCLAGTDGYFKDVNPAFQRELGWTEEELLKRPFIDFVHPQDVDRTVSEVERLVSGIPTVSFENRYLCKDGHYKRLRWATYPDPESGLLYAVAHVMGDG